MPEDLVRDGAVEEEVEEMQEAKSSNPCTCGEMRCTFESSPPTIAVKLQNFTALHRKIMYKICGEKKTIFHRLSCIFFLFFLDAGIISEITVEKLHSAFPSFRQFLTLGTSTRVAKLIAVVHVAI